MTAQAGQRNEVLFICAPGFGILDQWLPVVHELVHGHGLAVHVLFPLQESIGNANPRDLTLLMGDQLFSSATFRSVCGVWVRAQGLDQARSLAAMGRVDRLIKRFNNRSPVPIAGRLPQLLRDMASPTAEGRGALLDLPAFGRRIGAVLFDLHIADTDLFPEMARAFGHAAWFSLRHGPNVFLGEEAPPDKDRLPGDVTALLHAASEASTYQRHYGLPPERCLVTGVPRHEPRWVARICSQGHDDLPQDFAEPGGYVFLASRPGTTKHFPMERKLQAVEDVGRAVLGELGLKLVVKLHPKERQEGVFEQVLGRDSHGRQWTQSMNHPFSLGRDSLFAVTFLSSVCADMIAVGAPVIERLDLRGFDQRVSPRIDFDAAGNPRMQYLRDGLVLGACDLQQFLEHAREIEVDRQNVWRRLKEGYDGLFAPCEGSIERVCEAVLKGMERSKG